MDQSDNKMPYNVALSVSGTKWGHWDTQSKAQLTTISK